MDVEVWGITPTPNEGTSHSTNFKTYLFQAQNKAFTLDQKLVDALLSIPSETVFHLHGGFIPEFVAITKLFNQRHIKFLLTPHGSYNKFALRKSFIKKLVYYVLYERKVICRAEKIHLLGKYESSYITKLMPRKKHLIIPNGQHINPDKLTIAKRTQTTPIFGFMGRLDLRHKGLDALLKGFAYYKNTLKGNGRLWLLGDGQDKNYLVDLATTLEISNSVTFWGSKFGDEKEKLVRQFDVFLHPSRYDGVPMAVLESAMIGIPVIVSKATNTLSQVEEYGCGIGLQNIKPITIANSLLEMEKTMPLFKFQTMRTQAIEMIKAEFNWSIIAEKFGQTYTKLLAT